MDEREDRGPARSRLLQPVEHEADARIRCGRAAVGRMDAPLWGRRPDRPRDERRREVELREQRHERQADA
jgi:hypothetical protein